MAKKKPATKKAAAVQKAPTKSEIFGKIADDTELTRKQVAAVFESLNGVIKKSLSARGAGVFTMPGLCKMTVKKKPAVKAGMRMNPFTKEMVMGKAKPASRAVRIRPLKALKDMV